MAAASTPVPRGRLSSSTSPWVIPPLLQGRYCDRSHKGLAAPPGWGKVAGHRGIRGYVPRSALPTVPSALTAHRLTSVPAVPAALPHPASAGSRSPERCRPRHRRPRDRSRQRRVVSRPFSQGSLTSAGNPSTLCSRGGSPSIRAASSGVPAEPRLDQGSLERLGRQLGRATTASHWSCERHWPAAAEPRHEASVDLPLP